MAEMLLTNTVSRNSAEKYVEKLEGRTYMKFQVAICPAGGSFDIWIESDTGISDDELKEMVIEVLAQDLISEKDDKETDMVSIDGEKR